MPFDILVAATGFLMPGILPDMGVSAKERLQTLKSINSAAKGAGKIVITARRGKPKPNINLTTINLSIRLNLRGDVKIGCLARSLRRKASSRRIRGAWRLWDAKRAGCVALGACPGTWHILL